MTKLLVKVLEKLLLELGGGYRILCNFHMLWQFHGESQPIWGSMVNGLSIYVGGATFDGLRGNKLVSDGADFGHMGLVVGGWFLEMRKE